MAKYSKKNEEKNPDSVLTRHLSSNALTQLVNQTELKTILNTESGKKKSSIITISNILTALLTLIASILSLFIYKQQNQIADIRVVIVNQQKEITILEKKIKNNVDSLTLPVDARDYDNQIENINLELQRLATKDSTIENNILSLYDSLSNTRDATFTTPSLINPFRLPAITDTLFSVHNPYPKDFSEIRIDDDKSRIVKLYNCRNISERYIKESTVEVTLSFSQAIFTKIRYKCQETKDNRYLITKIEYLFNVDQLNYIQSRCITVFGERARSWGGDSLIIYEWPLPNGYNVSIRRYSETEYCYCILQNNNHEQ